MGDEKIDKAKATKDRFIHELNTIKTPGEYKMFVISFFYSQVERENMINLIGIAEQKGYGLRDWPAFQMMFEHKAYLEYSRKIHAMFITEEAKLGFML